MKIEERYINHIKLYKKSIVIPIESIVPDIHRDSAEISEEARILQNILGSNILSKLSKVTNCF